jgi:hypothetical protein
MIFTPTLLTIDGIRASRKSERRLLLDYLRTFGILHHDSSHEQFYRDLRSLNLEDIHSLTTVLKEIAKRGVGSIASPDFELSGASADDKSGKGTAVMSSAELLQKNLERDSNGLCQCGSWTIGEMLDVYVHHLKKDEERIQKGFIGSDFQRERFFSDILQPILRWSTKVRIIDRFFDKNFITDNSMRDGPSWLFGKMINGEWHHDNKENVIEIYSESGSKSADRYLRTLQEAMASVSNLKLVLLDEPAARKILHGRYIQFLFKNTGSIAVSPDTSMDLFDRRFEVENRPRKGDKNEDFYTRSKVASWNIFADQKVRQALESIVNRTDRSCVKGHGSVFNFSSRQGRGS